MKQYFNHSVRVSNPGIKPDKGQGGERKLQAMNIKATFLNKMLVKSDLVLYKSS